MFKALLFTLAVALGVANPLAAGRMLKEALAAGELRIGPSLKIPTPDMVVVLAGAGLETEP